VRELIYNMQPVMYLLFGFITLLIFPQRIDKKKTQAFLKLPHWRARIVLGVFTMLIISFVISFLIVPRPGFVFINTACIFLLFMLYTVKLFINVRKAVKD
jgi:Ca2+/Na+ antiporter